MGEERINDIDSRRRGICNGSSTGHKIGRRRRKCGVDVSAGEMGEERYSLVARSCNCASALVWYNMVIYADPLLQIRLSPGSLLETLVHGVVCRALASLRPLLPLAHR